MITWTFGPSELKIRKKQMSYVANGPLDFNSYIGIGMPIILKYVYNTTKHV